jgi:hypothetical protein
VTSMSQAAKSVSAWGLYLLAVGTVFLFAPNLALPLFGFPPTGEIWSRVVAMLSIILAYFYLQAARAELALLFRWKVYGHAFGVICLVAFVALGLAPWNLLFLVAPDLAAGVWTALALRQPARR